MRNLKHKITELILLLFTVSFLAADLSSIDSSVIGGSARTLGMGGMFSTVKGDPASIISNPAGLAANMDRHKFFLMSTKTLQEVNYLAFGYALPLEKIGTVGIGLINRSIGDIPLTQQLVLVNGQVDYSGIDYASFTEDVVFLSYANKANLFNKPANFGLNLKLFQKKTKNYNKGNASGMNMDLGMQVELNRDIDLGVKMQNIFVNSAGGFGSILWDTGEAETIDSYLITGISNKTLYRNLLLGIDLKKNLTRKEYPLTVMLGLEWHPHDALFFRCGMDQNLKAPDEADSGSKLDVVNNYTLGVGVNLYDWRFDYAYHPNTDIKDLTSHMFSISYVGPEPSEKPEQETEEELVTASPEMFLNAPEDRLVTTAVIVKAEGKVLRGDRYILNGEEYQLPSDGNFQQEVILALGINDVTLAIPGYRKKLIHKVLRLADFKDIDDSLYKNQITNIATLGYIKGDYPDRFNPRRFVSRAEMAALVIKINRFTLPLSMKGIWSDADILASQGILRGFPDGLLKADEKLTKAQVAMVIARLQNIDVDTQAAGVFAAEHWSEGAVSGLVSSGLYTAEDFSPRNALVTKEELVDLFSRLPAVQKSIDKMLNFDETGLDKDYSQEINAVFMRRPEKELNINEQNVLNDFNKLPDNTLNEDFNYQQMLFKEEVKPETQKTNEAGLPNLTILAPADKSIVYANSTVVQGNVSSAKSLYVNNTAVALAAGGSFKQAVTLKNGKNKLVVKAFNSSGKYARLERKIIKMPQLKDIPDDDQNKKEIAALTALGYINLEKDGTFKPAKKIVKAEYANIIARAYGITPEKALTYMQGNYKPNDPISRAFAVVVITRIENISVPAQAGSAYQDVDSKNWAYRHIAAAKNAGILGAASYFRPEETLDKKTAAIFLAKTSRVKNKINNLFNWNQGF